MAGFEIDIQHNIGELTKKLKNFEKKVVPAVTVRSLNKTGITVNKEAVRRVRLETKLPAKRIKTKLNIKRARRGQFQWTLTGLRGATNIIEWVPASKRVPSVYRKKLGVRPRAWGKVKTYPGTFIGKGKISGKLLVYRRDTKKGSGIASVYGPDVRRAFGRALVGLQSVASRRFTKVFEHELSFALSKLK